MKNPEVSIIIVQYKVKELLLECITSLKKAIKAVSYEIIVVDNEESRDIKNTIKKVYPDVIYISNKNRGFGQGNNVAAKRARGKYLFLLNPDTTVFEKTIKEQVEFLEKNSDVAIVAPLLLHADKKPFSLQGMAILTPLRGVVSLSFLNKLFPNNPISKGYWLPDWDRKKVKEVGVVPGTAFMMRKDLYEKVGGFDEKFFLYFEEFDLCKRVKELGYRICMLPQAKVIHLWGESTKQRSDISQIFQDSRFYYFSKHYGFFKAFLIECVARFSKEAAAVTVIIICSSLLSLWKIASGMLFIGDQAWFYLSARDLLLGHSFPLVGITSSHTWLHQGPLWTYLLAIPMWIGGYSPLSGAYLSITIHALTIFFFYIFGKKIFSKQVGLVGAILYAFSPYIIHLSRMPYHTSPIPLLTIVYFYFLTQWVKGRTVYLPFLIFLIAVLYNFELATVILIAPLLLVGIYGIWRRSDWITKLTKRTIIWSIVLGCIPLLPVILYDLNHGFKQTVGFTAWLFYSGFRSLFHISSQSTQMNSLGLVLGFLLERFQWLVFLPNKILSTLIILGSFGGLSAVIWKQYKSNTQYSSYLLLLVWILASIGILIVNKIPSDAYLPIIFPAVFFSIALTMSNFFSKKIMMTVIIFLLLLNIVALLKHNYSMIPQRDIALSQRVAAADTLVASSHGRSFALRGKGAGSQFESFLMPYEYVLWYKKHPVIRDSELKYIIRESNTQIIITRND